MMTTLGVTAFVAWAATAVALIWLLAHRDRVPPTARAILLTLLGVTLFWHTSNLLEWLTITDALDVYEDYVELLLPFLWGSYLYVWFQHTVTADLARSAQALDAERCFVSTVMRTTPAGIVTCNRQGKITFANAHAEQILGITQGDLGQLTYNAPAWQITGEGGESIPDTALPFRRVLTTGEPVFGVRHRVQMPHDEAGSTTGRLLAISGAPVRAGDGEISQVVFTVTDVTEEMRTQHRLARLNALLRAIRAVNQLIAREKDPDLLLAGVCTRLVSANGYQTARIYTPNALGELQSQTGAGASAPPESADRTIGKGLIRVWSDGGVLWTLPGEPQPVTGNGLPADTVRQRTGLARIEHGDRLYGVLAVQVPEALWLTDDEASLLEEVAGDVGFALHTLEQGRALHQALEAQARLLDRLRTLVVLGNQLSLATTTDELCRQAVELARDRLGFDRLGIWFRTEDPTVIEGAYGIDEQGQLRDERGARVTWSREMQQLIESESRGPLFFALDTLRNHQGQPVGEGTRVHASIWDGENHLGHISADNLLSHRRLGEQDAEVLFLYAATFGHLYGRLKGEQAARERDAIYRTIFQNTGTAMAIIEEDGTVSLVNDETVRLSGYPREEIENRLNVADFIDTADETSLAAYQTWSSRAEAPDAHLMAEMQVHNRNGTVGSVLIAVAWIPGTRRTVASLLDITRQKEAAAAHRRRAAQQTALNTIIAAATRTTGVEQLMATALDETLNALGLTRGVLWLSGLTLARGVPTSALPQDHGEAWPQDHLDGPYAIANLDEGCPAPVPESALHTMLSLTHELGVRAMLSVPVCLDLDQAPCSRIGKLVLLSDAPRQWSDEEIALVSAVGQQLGSAAERLQLLAQVQAQAERLQHVIDTVPEGVILIDQTRRVVLANLIARALLRPVVHAEVGARVSRIGDRDIDDLLVAPPRGSWHSAEAMGRTFEVIARPVVPLVEPEGWVIVFRDVTEAREIDEHRQQQDRLAAVGRLAAGIAHDFNNIMAVIMLYAQMGTRVHDMPGAGRQHFETIVEQAHRASNLIQQILDFSRRSAMELRPMSLLVFLEEVCRLLERTLPETIAIRFTYEPGLYRVNADPTRMQQVLMNLAINARDAMPGGGVLSLLLDTVEVGPGAPPVPDMSAGSWVRLRVSDTGAGISADIQSRLFEPFFTTKEPGLGTGLGLAQVHGILMQHAGAIRVESELGHGTVFTLYLPNLEDRREHNGDAHDHVEPHLPMGEHEHILVVEDNARTRQALVEALRSLNYTVLEASDGREGLALLHANAHRIALVLSDAVMPDMGGLALLDAVIDLGLTVPFIIVSGHSDPAERRRLQDTHRIAAWLPKPVPIEQLAEAVAAAVSGKEPKTAE